MADSAVRSQVRPTAGVWTVLHTAAASTVVSTIRACNTSRGGTDFIAIRKVLAGAAQNDAQFLADGISVPWGVPYAFTEGEALLDSDAIWVLSQNGTTAFNLSGVEID